MKTKTKKQRNNLLKILLCLPFFGITILPGQIPSTDIFISTIKISKDGYYRFSTPVNITNREGYDNQPMFMPNGKIYYTSLVDTTGTDIYMYDPSNMKNLRITNTSESEYSPTLMAGNKSISVVRVDKDSAQRLYQITPDGKASKLLLKKEDSVGYHCWLNNKQVALFILGDTFSLKIADINTQQSETVVSHIGRCIAVIPGTNQVSYVEKLNDTEWFIKVWYPETKKTAFLTKTLDSCEDYVWTPDKKILMGKEGKLYRCDPFEAKPWEEIGDFTKNIGQFYRIALDAKGTKIAFVSYTGKKP